MYMHRLAGHAILLITLVGSTVVGTTTGGDVGLGVGCEV